MGKLYLKKSVYLFQLSTKDNRLVSKGVCTGSSRVSSSISIAYENAELIDGDDSSSEVIVVLMQR